MERKLTPGIGVVILLACSTLFASNHVAARIAFDHGASVAAAVALRAAGTALLLFFMLRIQGISLTLPRELRVPSLVAGMLVAVQSYCLFSAVAVIPAALALLVFQTSVMLYVLLCWAMLRPTSNTFQTAYISNSVFLPLNGIPSHPPAPLPFSA